MIIQPLQDLARTHTCGELGTADAGKDVVLLGWVHRIRDLGSLAFIDIRDRHGITQVVARDNPALVEAVQELRPEYVVAVIGRVERRSPESVNPKLKTGEIEIELRELRLLNDAKTPPFPIADEGPVAEDTRLKYRYLDLRRSRMQRNMILRHRATMEIRKYFDEKGFLEIETPMLTKSTPEGARDYLVPSRVHPGEFYALPQSPQIFKQILMIAGLDRYFQIVKCFRDEDLRADRQPEFTQVDLEISFATEDAGVRDPRAADGSADAADRPRGAVPVPAVAVFRGDCEIRIGQAGSALRDGAGRARGRVQGVGVSAVQECARCRRRRSRVRHSRCGEVLTQPARRAGRPGEAVRGVGPGVGTAAGRHAAESRAQDRR